MTTTRRSFIKRAAILLLGVAAAPRLAAGMEGAASAWMEAGAPAQDRHRPFPLSTWMGRPRPAAPVDNPSEGFDT